MNKKLIRMGFEEFSPGRKIERLKDEIEELLERPCKIAMAILQNEIKAFCDRHKIDFLCGNGTFFFMNRNKIKLYADIKCPGKNSPFWKKIRNINDTIWCLFDKCKTWPDDYKSEA